MTRIALVIAALAVAATSGTWLRAQSSSDGRDADRAAIRAHIESICQAFLDGDIQKIHATHTEDWRGFLEGSRTPIKGIDAYMRANGMAWPPPAGTTAKPVTTNPTRAFKVFDFDVHFYTADIAVVNFFVDFGQGSGDAFKTGTRYRIMDIYVRRKGAWNQAASHTVVDPIWKAQRDAEPGALPPVIRQQLLDAREAVWRAFFTNDQAALDKLVPAETIEVHANLEKPFVSKSEILENAKRGAERGMKLVRLEFPKTEIQVYGTTAIIYTTYLYELETAQGQRQTSTGSATEVFVRRNGAWVNPGWQMAAAREPGR